MTTTFFDFIREGIKLRFNAPTEHYILFSPKESKPGNSGFICPNKPTIPVAGDVTLHVKTLRLLSGQFMFINLMFSKLGAMIPKTGIQPAKTPKRRAEKFTKFTGSHSEAIL